MNKKKTSDVFGVSTDILNDSYVDRGGLDSIFARLLTRNVHIGIRGQSKCGKSWLRKRNLPNALVVQCRIGYGITDIYKDALSQLGIKLVTEQTISGEIKGRLQASVARM